MLADQDDGTFMGSVRAAYRTAQDVSADYFAPGVGGGIAALFVFARGAEMLLIGGLSIYLMYLQIRSRKRRDAKDREHGLQ